jgi:small subunit ribosomal protein S11
MNKGILRSLSLLLKSDQRMSVPAAMQQSSLPTLLFNFLPNNIHVSLSDTLSGRLLFKLNSGTVGMKGTAKCSPKASLAIVDAVYARLRERSIGGVKLNCRGLNSARPLIVHQLKKCGLAVDEVIDTTRVPFNGCRPRKSRRL